MCAIIIGSCHVLVSEAGTIRSSVLVHMPA